MPVIFLQCNMVQIPTQNVLGFKPELKALHETSEEEEKLFLCQRLAGTVALSNTEWNHSFIKNEVSV